MHLVVSTIRTIPLDCGATLVFAAIDGVASVGLCWLLPPGSASDPVESDGWSSVLSELIFRGAGDLDSREHSDALDRLGVQRSSQVATHHLRLTATLVGRRLCEVRRIRNKLKTPKHRWKVGLLASGSLNLKRLPNPAVPDSWPQGPSGGDGSVAIR